MAEWEAWREPDARGYIKIYFKARHVKDYGPHNRRLCRYWIEIERQRQCTS